MPNEITKVREADLGQDWFACVYSDGTVTVRSPERGQRINLSAESAARLLAIFVEAGVK